MKMSDGRTFYYCKNGTQAVSRPGVLMFAEQLVDTEEDTNLASAHAAGSKDITFTATGTVTADEYAGGFLYVIDGGGKGQCHKIRSNEAISAASTGKVYLYDEIVTALTTASDVVLIPNPFNGVNRTSSSKALCMGINMIPLTASYHFWLQTWGWAFPLRGDSLGGDTGDEQILISHASGQSVLATAGGGVGAQEIGNNVYDSTDTTSGEWDLAYLRCIP
jgi:hypothetical protein